MPTMQEAEDSGFRNDHLAQALRQKAAGEPNSIGGMWGDWILDEAAARIETLERALQVAVVSMAAHDLEV